MENTNFGQSRFGQSRPQPRGSWVHFHWTNGQKQHFTKKGKKINCNMSNYVSFVVPGFSRSSSTSSSPTSSTYSSQDSVIGTENPATKRRATLASSTLANSYFGQFCFGQLNFGVVSKLQTALPRTRPFPRTALSLDRPSSGRKRPTLANPFLAIVVLARPILANTSFDQSNCGPIQFWIWCVSWWGPGGWGHELGSMKGGGPKFRSFFPLPPQFSLFLRLSGGFSRGILVMF